VHASIAPEGKANAFESIRAPEQPQYQQVISDDLNQAAPIPAGSAVLVLVPVGRDPMPLGTGPAGFPNFVILNGRLWRAYWYVHVSGACLKVAFLPGIAGMLLAQSVQSFLLDESNDAEARQAVFRSSAEQRARCSLMCNGLLLLPFSAKENRSQHGHCRQKAPPRFANLCLGYFGTFTATLLTMFEAR